MGRARHDPRRPLPDADKGSLLLQTAVTAATSTVASASGVPVSVLTSAIQLAYTVAKSAKGVIQCASTSSPSP